MNNDYLKNPLFSAEENLDIAIGGIEFRDNIIANLRAQIKALRGVALQNMSEEYLDSIQFKHIREAKEMNGCSVSNPQ